MAREDLNPVEEARACALLVEELGLTREEIGRRVGRSRVAVSNLLRLLDLPDEALELLAAGDLTEGHGRALLMAGDHDDRRRLARTALAEGWNVRAHRGRGPRAVRGARRDDGPVRAARGTVHPDQEAAASRLGEALGRALGADVQVTPRGDGLQGRADLRLARRGARAGVADRHRRAGLIRRYHRPARAISSVG